MTNQEEFEIKEIKTLEEKKSHAIVGATIYTIFSASFATVGILCAYKQQLTPAILEGIATIGTGIAAGAKFNEVENIKNRIKSLKK